jgi:hypothetical protein
MIIPYERLTANSIGGAAGLSRSRDRLPGIPKEAEACFCRALDVARKQRPKSFELRSATSLARLGVGQGRRTEARDLLAPIYHWFTEGFDTPVLQDGQSTAAPADVIRSIWLLNGPFCALTYPKLRPSPMCACREQ